MMHDDTRHGTITLFAALNQLTGKLITRTEAAHTHIEWLRFLWRINRKTPRKLGPHPIADNYATRAVAGQFIDDLDLHLIADNYATHRRLQVRAWLEKPPRFKMHFTPTSSSWLNLVERCFADPTGDVSRAGSFTSDNDLVRDINACLATRYAAPKPYVWSAQGADILARIGRARAALDNAQAA